MKHPRASTAISSSLRLVAVAAASALLGMSGLACTENKPPASSSNQANGSSLEANIIGEDSAPAARSTPQYPKYARRAGEVNGGPVGTGMMPGYGASGVSSNLAGQQGVNPSDAQAANLRGGAGYVSTDPRATAANPAPPAPDAFTSDLNAVRAANNATNNPAHNPNGQNIAPGAAGVDQPRVRYSPGAIISDPTALTANGPSGSGSNTAATDGGYPNSSYPNAGLPTQLAPTSANPSGPRSLPSLPSLRPPRAAPAVTPTASTAPPAAPRLNVAAALPPMPPAGQARRPVAPPPINNDTPAVPADARWTIYCAGVEGAGHVEQARVLKANLVALTGRKDFYVVSTDKDSRVCYGFYSTIESRDLDPAERQLAAHAQADREALASFATAAGEQPLKNCFFTNIDSADPPAPVEWNLALKDYDRGFRDPDRAFWSVDIADFKSHPERKEAAVQMCRDLRDHGVEAYFYHGESASSVCIGTWKRNALKEQLANPWETVHQDHDLLVSNAPLPGKLNGQLQADDGTPIDTLVEMPEIQDPSLLKMLKETYPEHYLNYEVMIRRRRDPKTGKQIELKDHSFLVQIPHPTDEEKVADARQRAAGQGAYGAAGTANGQANGAEALRLAPPVMGGQVAQPGSGHLRSLGSH